VTAISLVASCLEESFEDDKAPCEPFENEVLDSFTALVLVATLLLLSSFTPFRNASGLSLNGGNSTTSSVGSKSGSEGGEEEELEGPSSSPSGMKGESERDVRGVISALKINTSTNFLLRRERRKNETVALGLDQA